MKKIVSVMCILALVMTMSTSQSSQVSHAQDLSLKVLENSGDVYTYHGGKYSMPNAWNRAVDGDEKTSWQVLTNFKAHPTYMVLRVPESSRKADTNVSIKSNWDTRSNATAKMRIEALGTGRQVDFDLKNNAFASTNIDLTNVEKIKLSWIGDRWNGWGNIFEVKVGDTQSIGSPSMPISSGPTCETSWISRFEQRRSEYLQTPELFEGAHMPTQVIENDLIITIKEKDPHFRQAAINISKDGKVICSDIVRYGGDISKGYSSFRFDLGNYGLNITESGIYNVEISAFTWERSGTGTVIYKSEPLKLDVELVHQEEIVDGTRIEINATGFEEKSIGYMGKEVSTPPSLWLTLGDLGYTLPIPTNEGETMVFVHPVKIGRDAIKIRAVFGKNIEFRTIKIDDQEYKFEDFFMECEYSNGGFGNSGTGCGTYNLKYHKSDNYPIKKVKLVLDAIPSDTYMGPIYPSIRIQDEDGKSVQKTFGTGGSGLGNREVVLDFEYIDLNEDNGLVVFADRDRVRYGEIKLKSATIDGHSQKIETIVQNMKYKVSN